MQNVFFWRNARWTKRMYYKVASWQTRQIVPRNIYGNVMDFQKFKNFAEDAVLSWAAEAFLSYIKCVYSPTVEIIKKVACDCVFKNDNCFSESNNTFTSQIADIKAYYGVKFKAILNDIILTIKNNTVKQVDDNIIISVNKTEVIMEIEKTTSRAIDYNPVLVYKNDNRLYGQVVGSGFSVSQGGVNMCMPFDQTIQVFDPKITNYGVATVINGKYILQETIQVTKTDNQICFDVSDTSTYYPVMYSSTPINNPVVNSSSKIILNFTLLIIILIAFF
jgi:hypothetical protein